MGILVPTRMHQQNTGEYCGAACAQMALVALGMNPGELAQKALYDASHQSPWLARPDKLTKTLNDRWQNRKNLRFRLYCCADKAGLIQVMRTMFERFGESDGAVAIAITGLTGHWVVVRGFETDRNDPSRLSGFHLRNPLPALDPIAPEHPHDEDDDCCVKHGTCHNCHNMTVAAWSSFLHRVRIDGPWKDHYLVICPDRFVPGQDDQVYVPPAVETLAEPAPPAGPVLSTAAIEAAVARMVRDDQFAGVDCIADAITRTRPGTPILVDGLNADGSIDPAGAYYLVPFHDPEGAWGDRNSVPMAMAINAFTGEFEEVIASPGGSLYDPDMITPAGIARQASHNNMETVRNRAQPDSPFPYVAVWRQAEQTPTRFWPLFIGDQPAAGGTAGDAATVGGDTVFMRIDGQVVSDLRELHP